MSTKIIIAGDLCLQHRTANMTASQLQACHQSVRDITVQADYSILNLESAVTNHAEAVPIFKAGIPLKCDERILDLIQFMGFHGVTLANNHFADYGGLVVKESLSLLDKRLIDHVGAGLDINDAQSVMYKEIKGKTYAFINACEHEFTIATEGQPGCNALSLISQYHAIQEAKECADYILVIIHGGHENYQLPSPRMQKTYRFFIDIGADVVINHHQHCYSGYEVYNGKLIFYGLGNFSFDENGLRHQSWNEGTLLTLVFDGDINFTLTPYIQGDDEPGIHWMNDLQKQVFEDKLKELNTIIVNPEALQKAFHEMARTHSQDYINPLLPCHNKWIMRLFRYHLLPKRWENRLMPTYMTLQRRLLLKSYFQCETHSEIMNNILLNEYI